MNRSVKWQIPIYQTLEEAIGDEAVEKPDDLSAPSARLGATCKFCGKFTPTFPRGGWLGRHVCFADLQRRADADCETCSMVVRGIKCYQDRRYPELALPEYIKILCKPGLRFLVEKSDKSPSVGREEGESSGSQDADDVVGSEGIEFYVQPGTQCNLKHIGIGTPVSKDLSSEKCMQLASKWIKECQENHPRCKQPPSTVLPSRVIDVGSEGKEPFLVENSGNMQGQYVTLSHCWGKVRPLTTTLATLDDRKREIPLSLFPKTFQDAIIITRKLHIQYLWIDSLCIVQDSWADWEAESAKMAEIYRGSVFTIAATSAKDSREGCFIEKSKWRESVAVEVPDAQGISTTVYVREAHPKNHEIRHNFVFPDESLSRRAWVLQERLLSTRVLMYTSCELVFECKSELYCECGDFPLQRLYGASDDSIQFAEDDRKGMLVGWREPLIRRLAKLVRGSPTPLSGLANLVGERVVDGYLPDRPKAFRYWRDLVKQYTARKLTYDRDVLLALSGLASLVQRKVANDYLAGLWGDDLPVALLWSPARPSWTLDSECFAILQGGASDERIPVDVEPYLPRRATELCAPTWSWASIRGATDYDNKWLDGCRRLVQPARVLGATCTPTSSNPTGSVRNGSIILSAPLARVKLRSHEWHREFLCHRCRVGDYTCNRNHEHADTCINWNLDDWAVLDLPPEEPATLGELKCWRVRIGLKPPIHHVTFSDYSGRVLVSKLPDEISRTYTISYHLLLTKSKQKEGSFERLGLYIKLVPQGQNYDGDLRNVEIL